MPICDYCEEREAIKMLRSGKYCCCENYQSCPSMKVKYSSGLKKAHAEGKMRTDHLNRGWAKGLTAYHDSRINANVKYDPNEVFTYGGGKGPVKKILIIENGYECNECHLSDWNGKHVVLELDHIDGDRLNYVRDNLRLLCPNCHSQTDTFRGRNNDGKQKVTDEQIVSALLTCENFNQVFIKIGLINGGNNKGRLLKIIENYNLKIDYVPA